MDSGIGGRFVYRSAALNFAGVLISFSVLMLFEHQIREAPFLLLIVMLMMFVSGYIPCRYSADETCIIVRTGLKKTRIDLDSVVYADISFRMSEYCRAGPDYYENLLTIRTNDREYTFREHCGRFMPDKFTKHPEKVLSKTCDTELNRLSEYIKERI